MKLPKKLKNKLDQRKDANNYRVLTHGNGVDFFSNDYLGLARNDALHKINIQSYALPKQNGSTGSRLLSGNSSLAEELENFLSELLCTESTLLFNSGYNANTSLLQAVPQKGDTIIYDELIHASLKEGARLSFAKRFAFKHNSLEDLKNKLSKAEGDKYVVVESIYSMDGDSSPLKELADLCSTSENTYLIVDEAHSTGIWGKNGSGLCCDMGIEDKVFARIHTFGKAMGCHGACIAGSEELKTFLINFGFSFIYTTALPAHALHSIKNAFEYNRKEPQLTETLFKKITLFKNSITQKNFIESMSPIQVMRVGNGNEETKSIAHNLIKKGFEARPILSPTVKKGEERIRICLHSFNTDEEILQLTKNLNAL